MERNEESLRFDLEFVKNQFEAWRANRKKRREPIPEQLWEAAKELVKIHSINKVSRTLGLNYTDLKKRILGKEYPLSANRKKEPSLVELSYEPLFVPSECIIEMEDKTGCRMKMCFRGETHFDLLELGKSFWDKNR
ncbi:MAG: hypothetical protein C0403_18565 [Desulfobacterium sp.]|nr:hypothetical protein [Desulfobacterium sp.]